MLVCLGSCLFIVMTVLYLGTDVIRVIAAVITDVGFIGAGSIIAGGNNVKGVTTAANLWIVSGVGLATGTGAYVIAIITTILVFVILQIKRLEHKLK